jgi:hypothetical protein
VFDTVTGSDGERLYTALGWTRAGAIPEYATHPDGGRREATVIFYRLLG